LFKDKNIVFPLYRAPEIAMEKVNLQQALYLHGLYHHLNHTIFHFLGRQSSQSADVSGKTKKPSQ
jgi:hypothetical protein